jgi:hypothetical protein
MMTALCLLESALSLMIHDYSLLAAISMRIRAIRHHALVIIIASGFVATNCTEHMGALASGCQLVLDASRRRSQPVQLP